MLRQFVKTHLNPILMHRSNDLQKKIFDWLKDDGTFGLKKIQGKSETFAQLIF